MQGYILSDTIVGAKRINPFIAKKERRVKNRTRAGEKLGGERLDHIDALGLEFSAARTPKPPVVSALPLHAAPRPLSARSLFFSTGPRGATARRKKKLDFSLATLLCYLLYGTPVTDKYNRHSSPRIVPRRSAVRAGAFAFFSTLPRLPPFFVSPPRPSLPPLPPPPPPPHHQSPKPRLLADDDGDDDADVDTRYQHISRVGWCRHRRHRAPTTNAGYTGLGGRARELSFLLSAFFGIFPVAPGIVSRFVIVIRLHPAKRGLYSRALYPPPPYCHPRPLRLARWSLATCVCTGCIESRSIPLERRLHVPT